MTTSVEIVNMALTMLGTKRIAALTDNVKEAREMNAVYTLRRDALLRSFNWSFAMERTSLSALSDAPAWGYTVAYQLPSDCLRVVQVNDIWQVPGLSDAMGGPDAEPYKIEGRTIVTDFSAPLYLRYVKRVSNTADFDSAFASVFACDLAIATCEAITQSRTKKDSLKDDYAEAIRLAVRANAIELPPEEIPDDSWMLSRH